jgi:ATP-dependent helicase/nuclease subunit B
MFHAVATAEQPLSDSSLELDVVILSRYHEFRPVERLVDELPMIALLSLHQDGRTGVDAATEDALEVYEALDFETDDLPFQSAKNAG